MWDRLKGIHNLSLTVKIVSFIVFIVTTIFVTNIYIISSMMGLLLLIAIISQKTEGIVASVITMILFLYHIFVGDILNYLKIYLVLNHLILVIILIPKIDLIAIYYNVFYKPQDLKQVRLYLKSLYYKDKYRNNMQELKQVANNMGLDQNTDYYRSLVEKVTKKTDSDINELIEINYLRFYNVPKKKVKLEKKNWVELDNTFLIIHILLLIIAIIYRR